MVMLSLYELSGWIQKFLDAAADGPDEVLLGKAATAAATAEDSSVNSLRNPCTPFS